MLTRGRSRCVRDVKHTHQHTQSQQLCLSRRNLQTHTRLLEPPRGLIHISLALTLSFPSPLALYSSLPRSLSFAVLKDISFSLIKILSLPWSFTIMGCVCVCVFSIVGGSLKTTEREHTQEGFTEINQCVVSFRN